MKISKRQFRRIIKEERARLQEADWEPTGDSPAEKGAREYVANRRRQEKPPVNMDFLRGDPGEGDNLDITPEQEDALVTLEEAAAACVNARCDPKDMQDVLRNALQALPSFDQQLGYE